MTEKRIQIPALLLNYRSLADKTIRVTFETQELTPEQMVEIHSSLQKMGLLVFLAEDDVAIESVG